MFRQFLCNKKIIFFILIASKSWFSKLMKLQPQNSQKIYSDSAKYLGIYFLSELEITFFIAICSWSGLNLKSAWFRDWSFSHLFFWNGMAFINQNLLALIEQYFSSEVDSCFWWLQYWTTLELLLFDKNQIFTRSVIRCVIIVMWKIFTIQIWNWFH